MDILDFELKNLPNEFRNPDIIWASPPCQNFSVMTIPRYWHNGKPKSWKTYLHLAIAKKTVELIEQLKPKYFFIENPVGMLRKQRFMANLPRKTVTYCQYGKEYRKATDIWTNAVGWISRKPCNVGDLCHQEARRGMRRGIQGKVNPNLPSMAEWGDDSTARGIIPKELCEEILDYCEGKQKIRQEVLKCQ
jgi:site-specific DNA-cytosine methylase